MANPIRDDDDVQPLHKPTFRVYSGVELGGLPPPTWLLDNHVPEGGLVMLYGAESTGKSFISLSWSMAIATGQDWLARFPATSGPVVYVSPEGRSGMPQRHARRPVRRR